MYIYRERERDNTYIYIFVCTRASAFLVFFGRDSVTKPEFPVHANDSCSSSSSSSCSSSDNRSSSTEAAPTPIPNAGSQSPINTTGDRVSHYIVFPVLWSIVNQTTWLTPCDCAFERLGIFPPSVARKYSPTAAWSVYHFLKISRIF